MNNNILSISDFVKNNPSDKVQNLARYLTKENLYKTFQYLNGNKGSGIDKIIKDEYSSNLEKNINNLYARFVHMNYKPKP